MVQSRPLAEEHHAEPDPLLTLPRVTVCREGRDGEMVRRRGIQGAMLTGRENQTNESEREIRMFFNLLFALS